MSYNVILSDLTLRLDGLNSHRSALVSAIQTIDREKRKLLDGMKNIRLAAKVKPAKTTRTNNRGSLRKGYKYNRIKICKYVYMYQTTIGGFWMGLIWNVKRQKYDHIALEISSKKTAFVAMSKLALKRNLLDSKTIVRPR